MSESRSTRPRALVLTPRYPYPVIGGDRLRIHRVCRELAKRYTLTLLSLCESRAELTAPPPQDGVFARVERVLLPPWRSCLNVLAALPGRTPLQIAYYRSAAYERRVQQLLPEHDLCLAHLIRTGEYVRRSAVPTVLEMTDAISMNYQRVKALRGRRGLKAMLYAIEVDRLLAYERSILPDFDVVTLVSATDREFLLEGQPLPHVLVCSNGTDLAGTVAPPARREPVAAFIGNMSSVQNLDACHYFAEDVLPLLRRHRNWKFRVVGNIRPRDAARLRRIPGVEVTGRVESIPAAVTGALAGVCSVRLAAGVQNKVLEYMTLGLPAVTTSIGLEGLEAQPGREICVADAPDAFVRELERLYQDEPFAASIAAMGRAYVRRAHSWEERLRPMMDALAQLTPAPLRSGYARSGVSRRAAGARSML